MTEFSSSPSQNQVFLNFCDGKNVQLYKFVYHLVEALKINKLTVSVHMDEYRSIESKIAVVIFSGKYTESISCLQELTKINECVKKGKLVAIPIFFKLEKSTVKELRGQFGDSLRHLNHESKETKNNWKATLQSISDEPGHKVDKESLNSRLESEIVKNIVEDVKEKMNKITLEESQKASKPGNILQDSYTPKPKNCGIKQILKICCVLLFLFTLQQISYRSTPLDTFTYSSIDGKVKPPNIQVFISFRGDHLRRYFISHLVAALKRTEVNVFIDENQRVGIDLENLYKMIEKSGIAIVVLSSRYTEANWCLNELVKIKECAQKGRLKVFPIYYKVNISDVEKLKGKFGDNFRDKEKMYKSDPAKIKRWKEAIEFVTQKHAMKFHETSTGGEATFVREVVKEVLKMLQDIPVVEKKPIFWWFKAGPKS